MSFRVFNRHNRILSIEPNATLEKELRFLKRIVRGFDYRIAAAGDRRGTITMYVPFYRGVALTAYTASSREDVVDERGGLRDWLGDRMSTPEFSVREVTAEMFPLDDLDLSPAFIKVDVEGSELRVLRGLAATLERCHPILLIERSADFEAIHELLKAGGYAAYSYQADAGRFVPYDSAHAGPNVFFMRPDAVPVTPLS
jgi:FkbM family methyltransferase